jgi:hypothetical protein
MDPRPYPLVGEKELQHVAALRQTKSLAASHLEFRA